MNYSMNSCHRWYIPVGWYYTALLTTDNHPIIGWGGGEGRAVFCWKSRPRSLGDGPGLLPSTLMHIAQYSIFPTLHCIARSNKARICKPFKEHRNRFPTWQAGSTTLHIWSTGRLHRLVESIPWNTFLDKSMDFLWTGAALYARYRLVLISNTLYDWTVA